MACLSLKPVALSLALVLFLGASLLRHAECRDVMSPLLAPVQDKPCQWKSQVSFEPTARGAILRGTRPLPTPPCDFDRAMRVCARFFHRPSFFFWGGLDQAKMPSLEAARRFLPLAMPLLTVPARFASFPRPFRTATPST